MQNLSNVHHQTQIAYVMINCESDCETSVLDKLGEITAVKEMKGIIGNYDIIIRIESGSIEQLRDLISMKIRCIPQILTTTTLLCTDQPTIILTHGTH